jgi:hypothetical protein
MLPLSPAMSVAAIHSRGLPIPAKSGPEPLGTASGLRWSPALLDTRHQAMHQPEARVSTREGMSLLITPTRVDLSTEGLDGRVCTPLLEPSLVTAALHSFFTLFRRHQCPPPALS